MSREIRMTGSTSNHQPLNMPTREQMQITLLDAIDKIYNKEPLPSFERMYRLVYQLCMVTNETGEVTSRQNIQINPNQAYLGLYDKLRDHLREINARYVTISEVDLLEESGLACYASQWKDHKRGSILVTDIFIYSNRLVKMEGGYDSYELAMQPWRERLIQSDLSKSVTMAALKLVNRERIGETVDLQVVSDIKDCFIEMDKIEFSGEAPTKFMEFFKDSYFEDLERFYSEKCSELKSLSEIIKKAEQWMQDEQRRVSMCLDDNSDTLDRLSKLIEAVLIESNFTVILEGFQDTLDEGQDFSPLACIYTLLAKMPNCLNKMRAWFAELVHSQGLLVIEKCNNSSDNQVYVSTVLDYHKKFDALVKTAFKDDAVFVEAFEKAFSWIINQNTKTEFGSPEIFKVHDHLLNIILDNFEELEMVESMELTTIIFKYTGDKEGFIMFLLKLLAKLLVRHMLMSYDSESSIASKLNLDLDHENSYKLQRMVRDIGHSRNLNDQFLLCVGTEMPKIDLSFLILSSGYWPFHVLPSFSVPLELQKSVQGFTNFYYAKHESRKLDWLYHLSNGDLSTNCFKNKYILQVSTHQMALLLQYNKGTSFTVGQLLENTQMMYATLIQVIDSLIGAKVLTTEGDHYELQNASVISLNYNFINERLKVIINYPNMETVLTKKAVDTHFDDDFKIKAAIVRIMKREKVLHHQQLVAEVMNKLTPKTEPDLCIIEECINILIGKEYLERTKDLQDTYNYLAS